MATASSAPSAAAASARTRRHYATTAVAVIGCLSLLPCDGFRTSSGVLPQRPSGVAQQRLPTAWHAVEPRRSSHSSSPDVRAGAVHNSPGAPRRASSLDAVSSSTLMPDATDPALVERPLFGERQSLTTVDTHHKKGHDRLNHRILTAEEEKKLGRVIQRAEKLKAALADLAVRKQQLLSSTTQGQSQSQRTARASRASRSKSKRKERNSPLLRDMPHSPDLNPYAAMISAAAIDGNEERYDRLDTFDIDTMPLQKLESNSVSRLAYDNLQDGSAGTVNGLEYIDSASLDDLPVAFQDPPANNDSDSDNDIIGTRLDGLIDEHDIVNVLKLPGGRKQLNDIILQGAIARDTLIRCNLRLVFSIAKKWARQAPRDVAFGGYKRSIYEGGWDRPSMDEAIQEGIIGLAIAADRFNPSRNFKFGTYATYWITNYVRKCFHDAITGTIRVPTNYHDIRTHYRRVVREHYRRTNAYPTLKESAKLMNMSEKRLKYVLDTTRPLVSMDAPTGAGNRQGSRAGQGGDLVEDASVTLSNCLLSDEPSPTEQVEMSFLRQCLENAMATELTPYERDVVRLRLGLDDGITRSAREVAQICGGQVSVTDVRTTEIRALRKLRSPYAVHTRQLAAYLGFVGAEPSANLN